MRDFCGLDTMTTHEIAELTDALDRDRARRERVALRDKCEGNETMSALAMARAREEEEHG